MAIKQAIEVIVGVVEDGKVILKDTSLPDGTRVAVKALDPEEDEDTFHVTSEEKAELLDRIAAIGRGEFVDGREHLQQLRSGG